MLVKFLESWYLSRRPKEWSRLLHGHIIKFKIIICKVAFFHVRNLLKIRKSLTQKDTKTLVVHAFVSSKLDNCNSLLAELPQYLLDKVQRVQNAVACLVSCTRKYDRITPVLKELHWLLVKQRIIFKILLFTYKALKALAPQYISDFLVH